VLTKKRCSCSNTNTVLRASGKQPTNADILGLSEYVLISGTGNICLVLKQEWNMSSSLEQLVSRRFP
jgi:hypothetical protein